MRRNMGNPLMLKNFVAALAALLLSSGGFSAWAYDPFPLVGVTGDINIPASTGPRAIATLPAINTNIGVCGDATHVGQVTLNAKGQTTSCTAVLIAGGGGGGGTTTTTQPVGTNNTTYASTAFSTQALDTFPVSAYGALCNGVAHTVGSYLGTTSLSAIAAYTDGSGSHPYSWINDGTANYRIHLEAVGDVPVGNAFIPVPSVIGIPIGATIVTPNGGLNTTVTSTTVVAAQTLTTNAVAATNQKVIPFPSTSGLWVGELMPTIAGVPQNDAIASVTATTVTLANNITAQINSGTVVSFPPIGVIGTAAAVSVALKGRLTGGATVLNSSMLNLSLALTDTAAANAEMDWIGIASAIKAAMAAPVIGGGVVRVRTGRCIMDNASNVGTGVGTLQIPEFDGTNGNPVDLVGTSRTMSRMTWPTDLGIGREALITGNTGDTWVNGNGHYGAHYYEGEIRAVSFFGPSAGVLNRGQHVSWMDGMVLGAHRRLLSVLSRDFNSNITLSGDHTDWEEVQMYNGYCGLRFDDGSPSNYGDWTFKHLFMTGDALAGICVSKNAVASGIWDKPYFGGQPYEIFGEAGTPDNYGAISGQILNAVTMVQAQFEWIGNGLIIDDNVTTADGQNRGNKTRGVSTWSCDKCNVSQQSIRAITDTSAGFVTGRKFYHYFDLATAVDVAFTHMNPGFPINADNGGTLIPGLLSLIDVGFGPQGFLIEGDPSNFTKPNIPVLTGSGVSAYNNGVNWKSLRLRYPGTWSGHAELIDNTGTVVITPGMVLEQGVLDGAVLGTTGTAPVLGITMQSDNNAANDINVMATSGDIVPIQLVASVPNGSLIKKAAGAQGQLAAIGDANIYAVTTSSTYTQNGIIYANAILNCGAP